MRHSGTTRKHAGSAKHSHHGHPKHNPQHEPQHHKDARKAPAHHHSPVHHAHKAASSPKKSTPRGLAIGSAVACCSAEALAASLRLAGWTVTDADTLALYRLVAPDDDAGATIEETLRAAATEGLAGVRLSGYWPVPLETPGVVLGLELPGPHAVFQDAGRWWSWGFEISPAWFPGAVADEAWKVRWAL